MTPAEQVIQEVLFNAQQARGRLKPRGLVSLEAALKLLSSLNPNTPRDPASARDLKLGLRQLAQANLYADLEGMRHLSKAMTVLAAFASSWAIDMGIP